MTVAADLANRLNADAEMIDSQFRTVLFDYGMGIVDLLADGGYQPGDSSFVELEVSRDDAETYSEGQQLPDPLESGYQRPEFSFVAFRAVIRESGHERRKRGQGDAGLSIPDPQRKMNRAASSMARQIALYFDGTADGQLQGLIDATTAFGGLSRTTYSKLKSYELSGATAAVSTALIGKLVTVGADDPYGVQGDVAIASATQVRRVREVLAGKHAPTSMAGVNALVGTGVDLVPGLPLMMLPNLTNTEILVLSGVRSGSWRTTWNEPNPGRFHVLDLGAANSDTPMNLQISTSLNIMCSQPNEQSKLTSLSTG